MDFLNLLSRMPAATAQGLLWGLMALGVYISYKILDVADLSVDGTFALGGAVTVMAIIAGVPAWAALLLAILAGIAAGLCTGLLHTKLGIPAILSGILTQFALYSIDLRIMGMKANQTASLKNYGMFFENGRGFLVSSRYVNPAIAMGFALSAAVVGVLYWYFGTEQGSAVRATGANPQMSSAQGININAMKVLGLALSNGIVALSGGLVTQFQGTADVNMGRGAIVIGLAAVIIGEVIFGKLFRNFALKLTAVVIGAVIYYIVLQMVLQLGLNTNDLKLITALIVAVFLSVPHLREQRHRKFGKERETNAGAA